MIVFFDSMAKIEHIFMLTKIKQSFYVNRAH